MSTETIDFEVDGAMFGLHAETADSQTKRPAVLVCHAWAGQGDNERNWARELSSLGYVGIAHDVYGKGVMGSSVEENSKLMTPLMEDRATLGRRLVAGVEAARKLPYVDPDRVAAIGFCFGGLCVLDLARRNANVKGVIAVHGLFMPLPEPSARIDAKVLVLHGYDDPMGKPESMVACANELTAAGADWQIHAYGGTQHAFTNPGANTPELGLVYSERATRRARASIESFLAELF